MEQPNSSIHSQVRPKRIFLTEKKCCVTNCKSTSRNSQDLIFFLVPQSQFRYELYNAIEVATGIRPPYSMSKVAVYTCESHYKLDEDVEHWERCNPQTSTGTYPIRLKKGVLPHIFPNILPQQKAVMAPTSLENLYSSIEETNCEEDDDVHESDQLHVPVSDFSTFSLPLSSRQRRNLSLSSIVDELAETRTEAAAEQPENEDSLVGVSSAVFPLASNSTSTIQDCTSKLQTSKALKPKKAKSQCTVDPVKLHQITQSTGSLKTNVNCECKAARHSRHKNLLPSFDSPTTSNSQTTASPAKSIPDSDYVPKSSSYSSTNTDFDIFDTRTLLDQSKAVNLSLCSENSKLLVGIEKEKLSVLKVLQKHVKQRESERDILIVLRKIKLNDSFDVLGLYFGLSGSQVAKNFNETLPKIAKCFKTFIFKPPKENIHLNLPVAFRANYFMVSEIIDCFEVGIEKPINPVHQALTWSDYKQQNTLKILISCTPDGYINFVSKAYGGRISDLNLAIKSGYVEGLQENTTILADRGFKHLESDLAEKQCKLFRPPSVSSEGKLTEKESLLTKQVAALRIHIERVIGRVREFKILTPHCVLDHNLIGKLDDIVTVASGLSNLQNKITRF